MKCDCADPIPVSRWWAEECCAQNHRASPGQLVCSLCGGGIDCTPEEYAKVEQADRDYEAREAAATEGGR